MWNLGSSKIPLYERMAKLWGRLEETRTNYQAIDMVAAEHPFVHPRHRLDTAIKLGCAVGVVMGWAILYGFKFKIISPASAKKAITKSGAAKKIAVQDAAKKRFGLDTVQEDEADAIAVCLAAQEILDETAQA